MNHQEEEEVKDHLETEEDTDTLEQDASAEDLDEAASALDEMKDKYLRLMAEFENYKRRSAKEKQTSRALAGKDTLMALLPVLDDFDRAKKVADDDQTEEIFTEGVQLVYDKLNQTLKRLGLERMDTDGAVFHADLHEAITEIPAPSPDMTGHIIDTIEHGYKLNDIIIRHAKVVVGK